MAYLEELLPEFRKGAKIRCVNWKKDKFLSLKENGSLLDQDGDSSFFYGADLLSNEGEFYKDAEPDWDYIINNQCLCWFWDYDFSYKVLRFLRNIERDLNNSFLDENHSYWKNCRPACRDEVTFYEEKEDE